MTKLFKKDQFSEKSIIIQKISNVLEDYFYESRFIKCTQTLVVLELVS